MHPLYAKPSCNVKQPTNATDDFKYDIWVSKYVSNELTLATALLSLENIQPKGIESCVSLSYMIVSLHFPGMSRHQRQIELYWSYLDYYKVKAITFLLIWCNSNRLPVMEPVLLTHRVPYGILALTHAWEPGRKDSVLEAKEEHLWSLWSLMACTFL